MDQTKSNLEGGKKPPPGILNGRRRISLIDKDKLRALSVGGTKLHKKREDLGA